jgi:NAD(P)-dependent dehydrogenase (short-subunit alcohol dehydrogenase family)
VRGWHSLGVTDQYGRRAVVTGANTGLGFQTSLALAGAGAEVIMAVRDLDRGQDAAQRIRDRVDEPKLRVLHLDLADLSSVREFAAEQAATGPLDLLVNNAGLMLVPRRELTRDGFESQMGVNHLGHFALTAGLLPALQRAEAGRVVSVTSIAARRSRSLDHGLGLAGKYTPMRAYSQSKLAVALFAEELDRRLRTAGSPVASVLAHPGWSSTAVEQPAVEQSAVEQPGDEPGLTVRLGRRATAILGSSPRAGATSQVYAATAPQVSGGELVGPRFLARGTPHAAKLTAAMTNAADAEWLWQESTRLTGAEPLPVAR